MAIAITALKIALIPLSIVLATLILMHKGKGGGMSSLLAADSSTSGVAEKNLNRITVVVGVLWIACIFAADLLTSLQ